MPQFIQEDLPDAASQIQLTLTEPLSIQFDESQFRQVLINLIRNAIRHNTAQQPIEITAYPQATYIYIDVRDFGAGVASQDLLYLFQPFFSTEINGTGLGLYLSHSFCEANQPS